MIRKSQIWIETVMYTLIGLVIMGALLAIMTPKLKQMEDRSVLTQTEDVMASLSQKISEIQTEGNQRLLVLRIKKGDFYIDGVNDSFNFALINSKLKYSEVGQLSPKGEIIVLTQENNDNFNIFLTLNKKDYNITFQDKDVVKKIIPANSDYTLLIQSKANKTINFDFV